MADDVQSRLAAALSHRYAIERELGSGGMLTAYFPEDLERLRRVVVKAMKQESE